MTSIRQLCLLAGLLFAALIAATGATAADFPTKPIRIVVPFPPGGLLDTP